MSFRSAALHQCSVDLCNTPHVQNRDIRSRRYEHAELKRLQRRDQEVDAIGARLKKQRDDANARYRRGLAKQLK